EGLEVFARASALRKQAADFANQAEVAQAKLQPMQADLAVAQAREQALASAVDLFTQMAAQIEKGWKDIEASVIKQQANAKAILQGGGAEASAAKFSIAQKGDELSKAVAG